MFIVLVEASTKTYTYNYFVVLVHRSLADLVETFTKTVNILTRWNWAKLTKHLKNPYAFFGQCT